MDIGEIKNIFQKKTESDNLTRQVKKRIKETTWEKQNQREGFTETFKPLISQFEDPGDDKTKNIYTQNRDMLQNQIALTKELKDNQKAINYGLNQLERLADMGELPSFEAMEDDEWNKTYDPEKTKEKVVEKNPKDFDHILGQDNLKEILKRYNFDKLPSDYFNSDIKTIDNVIAKVEDHLEDLTKKLKNVVNFKVRGNYEVAIPKSKNPKKTTQDRAEDYNTLQIYAENLSRLAVYKEKRHGSGINNYNNLVQRLKLLGGSIMAGNYGVVPEFIQIIKYLNNIGVLPTNELKKVIKTVQLYLN